MIWYDVHSGEPIAPGACEDAGAPSIPNYVCMYCNTKRELEFDNFRIGQLTTSIGRCRVCKSPLLTSG